MQSQNSDETQIPPVDVPSNSTPARTFPRDSRWKAIILTSATLAIAACLVAGMVMKIRANRLPTMTRETFNEARARWERQPLLNYEIAVRVSGMQPGLYEVRVEDGVAVAAAFEGNPLTRQRIFGTWSVPGMFQTLARDLETQDEHGYLMLSAEFDENHGYVARYQRIEMRTGAHDALQWQVVKFEPTP